MARTIGTAANRAASNRFRRTYSSTVTGGLRPVARRRERWRRWSIEDPGHIDRTELTPLRHQAGAVGAVKTRPNDEVASRPAGGSAVRLDGAASGGTGSAFGGRRARGGQRRHGGRRRELYKRPRVRLNCSRGRARKGQQRGCCCLTTQRWRNGCYGRISTNESGRASVPCRSSGRTRLAAQKPPRLEGGTRWRRRRSPARAQRLAARARRGDVVLTVHRWLSEALLEKDVVVAVGGCLRSCRRVTGENWGVSLFRVERIGARALRIG